MGGACCCCLFTNVSCEGKCLFKIRKNIDKKKAEPNLGWGSGGIVVVTKPRGNDQQGSFRALQFQSVSQSVLRSNRTMNKHQSESCCSSSGAKSTAITQLPPDHTD